MIRLQSYLGGHWLSGEGEGASLVDPTSGIAVASASSQGLDLGAALRWSRATGGPALRALSFAQRGAALEAVAGVLKAKRGGYLEIAVANSGNTAADAAIDIDGAIGTILYYAKLGKSLGELRVMRDGDAQRLTRDENYQGLHLLVSRRGVAVHINAFNFPAWGLWEKAAVALLAGVPVLAKPAVATAWLAQQMAADVVAAKVLPEGALSILCGSPAGLLDALDWQDVLGFTGSAATAIQLRRHPRVIEQSLPLNVEADSLNACALGPDVQAGSALFETFAKEVAREMTIKSGQRCTAVRRILVPQARTEAVIEALRAQLAKIVVGNPRAESVRMGPLVSKAQQSAVRQGLQQLRQQAELLCGGDSGKPVDASAEQGAFLQPTLLRANADAANVHDIEVFGPVATVVPYADAAQLYELAARGRGSLVMSTYSDDHEFLQVAMLELAHAHGRLMAIDSHIAATHSGHGNVLPSCTHGGPGRAGGGEELGALRGLRLYQQRTAVQASSTTISRLHAAAAPRAL